MNHPFVYADTPMVVSVKAFMVMMLTPQENRNAAKTTVTFIIAWALHKNTYWYFVVFFLNGMLDQKVSRQVMLMKYVCGN